MTKNKKAKGEIQDIISKPPTEEGFVLIKIEKKTKFFLLSCTILFFMAVFLKIHGSSIPIWNQIIPAEGITKKTGLISGKPQSIRSDEWAIQTPFLIAQSRLNFPISNESLGAANSPLILNMPIKGITMVLKPQFWGFVFFDVERAFAFYWNFRVFGLVVGFFLLLMILTKSNFWISLLGSIWLFLSSGIQWWFSTFLVELIVCFCFIVILAKSIAFGKSIYKMAIASVLLICFIYTFVTLLYPPWQIPIAYLGLIIFGGFSLKNFEFVKPQLIYKVLFLSVSLGLTFLFLYFFFVDSKETIQLISDTVYPGQRSIIGGNLEPTKFFAEYFGLFMEDAKLPKDWGNICEVSTVLLFFPVVIFDFFQNFYEKRKNDLLIILLLSYMLYAIIWMFVKLPDFIGAITLFKRVTTYRLLVIFGLMNIIATIYYIGSMKERATKRPLDQNLIFFFSSAIFLFILLFFVNKQLDNYFSLSQIIFSTLLFSIMYFLLFNVNMKYSMIIFSVLIVAVSFRNTVANPISVGLAPIINHPLNKAVSKIVANDKDAKWAVFGNFTWSNFIKTTGANVFTGTKWVPNLQEMRKLDSSSKNDTIYNRYGYVTFMPYINNDSIIFQYAQQDLFTVGIDPCSPKMKEIGIKYVVFAYPPQTVEVRCMELFVNGSQPIYKIK